VTDEDRPHRPNEKYKLSKGGDSLNIKEEDIVFYYNREHRLAKAPQSVKNLYVTQKKSRFSLIRPLVADKPRAMLFVAILVICAGIIVFSILGYFDKYYTLEGNKIEISGTVFEETTIVVLRKTVKDEAAYSKGLLNRIIVIFRKTVKDEAAYSGAVDIVVSAAAIPDEETPLFYHRVFFTLSPEEEYQFVVPFNSPELIMLVQTEKSVLKIKLKPK